MEAGVQEKSPSASGTSKVKPEMAVLDKMLK